MPLYSLLFICKTGMKEMSASYMLAMFKMGGTTGNGTYDQWIGIRHVGIVWTVCEGSSEMYRKMVAEMGSNRFKVATHVSRVIPKKDGTQPQVCYNVTGGEQCDSYDEVILASPADDTRQ